MNAPRTPNPTQQAATPLDLARAAGDAVRALNYATARPGSGYVRASDVDATLAELAALLEALPQTVRQAVAWLRDADRHSLLAHEAGTSTHLAITFVAAWLDAVSDNATEAAGFLTQARDDTHHLSGGRP